MSKEIRIILSKDAQEVYEYLVIKSKNHKLEKSVLFSFNKKINLIKLNKNYGDPIAKNKIPFQYRHKYGLKNLFRVELSNYWRMLYTLTNDKEGIEIVGFVLEIFNHNDYNKVFGYKKR